MAQLRTCTALCCGLGSNREDQTFLLRPSIATANVTVFAGTLPLVAAKSTCAALNKQPLLPLTNSCSRLQG